MIKIIKAWAIVGNENGYNLNRLYLTGGDDAYTIYPSRKLAKLSKGIAIDQKIVPCEIKLLIK